MQFDNEAYNLSFRNQDNFAKEINKYLMEPIGSGLYTIPLLTVLFCSAGKDNQKDKQVALTGIKAFIISGAFEFAAKQVFHRSRPGDSEPPNSYSWRGPGISLNHTSFPSGHTTTVFAVASVLAKSYNDKKWVGITSYSIAFLTGLSRIYCYKHWLSDVVAGAVLGTYIGHYITEKKFREKKIKPVSLKLGFNSASLLVTF